MFFTHTDPSFIRATEKYKRESAKRLASADTEEANMRELERKAELETAMLESLKRMELEASAPATSAKAALDRAQAGQYDVAGDIMKAEAKKKGLLPEAPKGISGSSGMVESSPGVWGIPGLPPGSARITNPRTGEVWEHTPRGYDTSRAFSFPEHMTTASELGGESVGYQNVLPSAITPTPKKRSRVATPTGIPEYLSGTLMEQLYPESPTMFPSSGLAEPEAEDEYDYLRGLIY